MIKKIFLLFITFSLLGCLTTNLETPKLSDDAIRLANANNNPICVEFASNAKTKLGHQFLIPYIPVGKIYFKTSLDDAVKNTVYTKLSMVGFTPLFNERDCKENLKIKITSASINAYDLFATRYIVSKILYEVSYSKNQSISPFNYRGSAEYTSFKRFAFDSELNYAMQKTIEKLGNDIADAVSR